MSESTSHHDNLRDQIGQALNDAIASGAPQADYCDSREVDRLAEAVMPLVAHLERQRANLLRRQGETFDQMAARRRARIDAAQTRGETPPRDPALGCGGYFDPLWLDADDDSPLPVAGAALALAAQAPAQGEPVELPPLPEPKYCADDLTDIYTGDQMREFARAAIDAARKAGT